jgi:rhamnose transport system permease protein
VPDFWQQAVVGALILAAIVLDRVLQTRTARRLQEQHAAPEIPTATERTTGTEARA